MALVEETKRIVDELEYTDDDVNKGVQEFLRQIGMSVFDDPTPR